MRCRTHHALCNLIAFPQNTPNFHKNRAFNPLVSGALQAYLSTQRRSNPPEGESRQEPSESRKRSSQEPRERIFDGTGSGTRKGTAEGPPDETRERSSEENRQRDLKEHRRRTPKGDRRGSPQGNPKRDSRSTRETRPPRWDKKALTAKCDDGVRETAGSARTSRITLK
jgi:hypothetical protein